MVEMQGTLALSAQPVPRVPLEQQVQDAMTARGTNGQTTRSMAVHQPHRKTRLSLVNKLKDSTTQISGVTMYPKARRSLKTRTLGVVETAEAAEAAAATGETGETGTSNHCMHQTSTQARALGCRQLCHPTTHLAVVHDSLLDQEHNGGLLVGVGNRVVVLVAHANSQACSIRREGECRNGSGILGIQAHALLSTVVPDRQDAV